MNSSFARQRNQNVGWLRKQGGMVKTWHRRWFVLNGDCLFYFSKEDDLKSLGNIFLPGNRVVEHSFCADEPDKFMFEILPGAAQSKMTPNHETFLLCAVSDAERQQWIKAIRKVVYSSKGGAIFGQSIEDTMQYEHSRRRHLPYIIEACVEFLRENGLENEGLFRLAGRTSLVRELKEKFDCGEKVVLNMDEVDINSVASLLKQYMRELPESIIPCRFYQRFMNMALRFLEGKDPSFKMECVKELKVGVSELPADNYNILKYLCEFLYEVGTKSAINKMTTLNLATVFGPNIIRHMDDNPELFMVTADLTQQLAFMLIQYGIEIFSEDQISSSVAVDDILGLDHEEVGDTNKVLLPQTVPSPSANDLLGLDFAQTSLNDVPVNKCTVAEYDAPGLDSYPRPTGSTGSSSPDGDENDGRKYVESGRPIPPKRRSKLGRGRNVSDRSKHVDWLKRNSSGDQEPGSPLNMSLDDETESPKVFISPSDNGGIKWVRSGQNELRKANSMERETTPQKMVVRSGQNELRKANSMDRETTPPKWVRSGQNELRKANSMEREPTPPCIAEETDSKVTPSTPQLHMQVAALKDELARTKSKYEFQVKSLKTEMLSLRETYEKNISRIETSYKSQEKDLRLKLASETRAKDDAVCRVMNLQDQLHQYQLKFGDISMGS